MEIKKRLVTTDSNEVNAVMINDEGEEYPVFLESLHNTIIFPALIQSGYVLDSLPYGFVRHGVRFDDLPVERYHPTAEEEELMYNSIGAKTPYDEIKEYVSAEAATGLATPETNYTIFTREDLLKYLDATAIASSDDDFMPLNYFVAPDARFTHQEYFDLNNLKYRKLIEDRRILTVTKFYRMVEAFKKFGLPENYTEIDVLDVYFSWGICGLQFVPLKRVRESRPFRLSASTTVNIPVTQRTCGFIDGMQNQHTPKDQRHIPWKLMNKDPNYVNSLTQGMQMNDTKLVEFKAPGKIDVTTLDGVEYNVRYSSDEMLVSTYSVVSLRVRSLTDYSSYIDISLALPNKVEALYEHCKIEALARLLYSKRKSLIKVSSYDALTVAGCNPKAILDYVIVKLGLHIPKTTTTEKDMPYIDDRDVDKYLAESQHTDDDVSQFLTDVLTGEFNIDSIEQGKKLEASVNIDSAYREIYALHHALGIPLEEIYEKYNAIDGDTQSVVFSNGQLQHTVDTRTMNYSVNGYKRDVLEYDLQNASNCTFFTYVTLVAKEAGSEESDRHVGIEFFLVNKKFAEVKKVLAWIEQSYTYKVQTMIPDAAKQANQMRLTQMFVLSRYFEIALNGTLTWPAILGGTVDNAPADIVLASRKHLERKIECITSYCKFTAQMQGNTKITFNAYCTNAYITPQYVIPRSDAPIKEVPFFAVWHDWQRTSPDVWRQLVERGVLTTDFVPWCNRYTDEQFVQRGFAVDSNDSLFYYYDRANEEINSYPENKEFVSVKHPIEYMYPGAVLDDEPEVLTNIKLREGKPVVRIGNMRMITKKDYAGKLIPDTEVEKPDTYITEFMGFSAEALLTVPNVLSKIPGQADKYITVIQRVGMLYVEGATEGMHYSRIGELDTDQYPVVHVNDRTYLLRSTDGKLWEVRV